MYLLGQFLYSGGPTTLRGVYQLKVRIHKVESATDNPVHEVPVVIRVEFLYCVIYKRIEVDMPFEESEVIGSSALVCQGLQVRGPEGSLVIVEVVYCSPNGCNSFSSL